MGSRFSQYEHVATEEGPAGLLEQGRGSRPSALRSRRLRESSPWQCGEARLALRQLFNVHELDAAEVVARYDSNGSKVLEACELRRLLQDYNNGRRPKKEELDFVLHLCGITGQNGGVSQEDLLFALRAWYAFNHMPKTVGEVLNQSGLGNGEMPTDDALLGLLVELNEFQPVGREEVNFLREAALHLGATESRMTRVQLRQAVAAWYLHIERPETQNVELLRRSFAEAHDKVVGWSFLRALLSGEIDPDSRGFVILLSGLCACCILALPLTEIAVSASHGHHPECERPGLNGLLRSTGILSFLQAVAVLVAVGATVRKADSCRTFAWVFAATLALVLAPVCVYGASQVLESSGQRCGHYMWHFCHFVYITLPVLLLVAGCCGPPCSFCAYGGAAFARRHGADRSMASRCDG